MNANKKPMAPVWTDLDEAPDLSEGDWAKKLALVDVKRGRPKAQAPKVSTTLRLDADIVERFRADGPGWQSRINAVLRDWVKAG
jgi:uncharacterized protein (DUF4415 family)